MMLTRMVGRSWLHMASLSRCFSKPGMVPKTKKLDNGDIKKEKKVYPTPRGSENGPRQTNYRTEAHERQNKTKFRLSNSWTDKPPGSEDHDDEMAEFVVSLDEKELQSIAKRYKWDAKQAKYFRIIIEGKGSSKFSSPQIKEILEMIEELPDMDAISTSHLQRAAKWTGTSIARKLANSFARNIFLKLYFELVKRKCLPLLVGPVNPEDEFNHKSPTYDPIESDRSCEEVCKEHPELLKILPSKIYDLFYDETSGKATLDPKKFFEFMDLVVCMSNLNIYHFEAYQSAKLMLWYMMNFMQDDVPIHTCMTTKATNFYWAFTRVRVPDSEFTSSLLLFYTLKYLHKNRNRQFNLLHCLGLELVLKQHYFKTSKTGIKPIIGGIRLLLEMMRDENRNPYNRVIFNPKNSIMYGQIMLNLFPELGPLFRGQKELIDFEPLPDNPFRDYFYDMTDYLVTYLWISQTTIMSKKFKGRPNITIYNNGERIFHIARESNMNQLLLYQNKVVVEVRKVPAVKTLVTDVNLAIYEADLVINDDYVLEVDSKVHFVACVRELPIISQFLKTHHLKIMGFKNVLHVGVHDKVLQERVYSEHSTFFKDLVATLLSGKER